MAFLNRTSRFEREIRPHLKSAYNLARWLTRNDLDAEDVLQESLLRAYRFFGDSHGDSLRAWFLQIVRNSSYTFLRKNRGHTEIADEEMEVICDSGPDPEARLLSAEAVTAVRIALSLLPPEFCEVLVLRELDGCSYAEIVEITGLAEGTVMSRLARGRARLRKALTEDRRDISG